MQKIGWILKPKFFFKNIFEGAELLQFPVRLFFFFLGFLPPAEGFIPLPAGEI
jgi:hypothetical protein